MKISKEYKIGIVVTAAIAVSIWGFNFLKGFNLFSHQYELYAVYPKIDGLIEANPLLINGYKVGQINKISLTPDNNGSYKVLVKFLLTEDVKIPKHSIARAISSDLLGSKAVEIIYSNSPEFVESGDTLIAETEEGLKTTVSKQLAPLQKKVDVLLSSVDSVMTIVQVVLNDKTRDNLNKSFESIKKAILMCFLHGFFACLYIWAYLEETSPQMEARYERYGLDGHKTYGGRLKYGTFINLVNEKSIYNNIFQPIIY